jgi:hypothetical protein
MIRTQNNHSRGRTADGAATWGLFTTPNPNGANVGALVEYADRPVMSVAPGFYTSSQNVALSTSQPNITIRYTTNGTIPTATSTIYSTPIVVNTTTVIRAVCFSSDPTIVPSFTETNTFFMNVTHSPSFNVISVCGNYTSLFSTGNDIRTSVEFFDTLKNFKWEYEGSSQKHGHDSWAYPQKAFRIYAEDEYGYLDNMPEQFFPNSPRAEFKQIILKAAASGAILLLNSPYDVDTVWENLPLKVKQQILTKNLKVYTINASQVAKNSGMGHRINTIMQVCFFALAGVLPEKEAIAKIKQAIEKTYGKKGAEVVNMNLKAVDNTLENLHEIAIPLVQIGNYQLPITNYLLPITYYRLWHTILELTNIQPRQVKNSILCQHFY